MIEVFIVNMSIHVRTVCVSPAPSQDVPEFVDASLYGSLPVIQRQSQGKIILCNAHKNADIQHLKVDFIQTKGAYQLHAPIARYINTCDGGCPDIESV